MRRRKRQKAFLWRIFSPLRKLKCHGPLALSVIINCLLIGLASFVVIRQPFDRSQDAMKVTLASGFLTQAEPPAPPSGGSQTAIETVLSQAVQQLIASTPSQAEVSPVTTTAISPISIKVQTPAPTGPSQEALVALQTTGQAETLKNSGVGESPSTAGEGSGVGDGAINGVKISKYPGRVKAAGNFGPGWANEPGEDTFKGQKIVMLVDKSQSVGNNTSQEIVDAIVGSNEVLDTITFYRGWLVSSPSSQKQAETIGERGELSYLPGASPFKDSDGRPIDFSSAYWALMKACNNYSGQNAIVVVLSDFNEMDSVMEEVPYIVQRLLDAKLRLYLVRVDSVMPKRLDPSPKFPSPTICAIMSGGGSAYFNREKDGGFSFQNPRAK